MLKCPICNKEVGNFEENKSWPFCGERCKLIDLGDWLAEKIYFPGESVEIPEEELDSIGYKKEE